MTIPKYEQSMRNWTLADELYFIRNIGSFSNVPNSKAELLRSYLRTCEIRVKWDFIDRKKCIRCAKNFLLGLRLGDKYEIDNVQYKV